MVLCSLQPVSEDNARSGLWKGGRPSLCLDGAVFSPASVPRQFAKWTVEGGGVVTVIKKLLSTSGDKLLAA